MDEQRGGDRIFETPRIGHEPPEPLIARDDPFEVGCRNHLRSSTGKFTLRGAARSASPNQFIRDYCIEGQCPQPHLALRAWHQMLDCRLGNRRPAGVRHQQANRDPSRMIKIAVEMNSPDDRFNHVTCSRFHHSAKSSNQDRLEMGVVHNSRCHFRTEAQSLAVDSDCEVRNGIPKMFERAEHPMPRVSRAGQKLSITKPIADRSLHGSHHPSLAHNGR